MRKTHRKIVSGALLCGCALFTLYGASRIAERAESVEGLTVNDALKIQQYLLGIIKNFD